ncbi:MAG: hypothetical protein U9Q30_09060 [Campylobacterota bacterium]|nr:hypothetical protein [Campylobacterota bacterium]
MKTIIFNNIELHLKENKKYEFLLSNKEVAIGYGTNIQNLAHTKNNNSDELIEGKHWLKLEIETKGGKQKVIHWTKKGIVRLGFFIKSKKAREFRDWAEDYIIQSEEPKPIKNDIDIQNINDRLKLLENIVANNLTDVAKNTSPQNQNITIDPKKTKSLDDAKTVFRVSKTNKNDDLKDKEKFYQDILKVIANYPYGASQRTLLKEAGYSQSKKIRRWLQEQISILWDMTIIPGKCYKYTLR